MLPKPVLKVRQSPEKSVVLDDNTFESEEKGVYFSDTRSIANHD